MHFAHSKATLHRDLKPANILLEPAEEAASELLGFRPLLSDFGLAKRIDQASKLPNSTQAGGMLGTIRYMSPEQAIGATQDIGTTSDIFSLGIILYELVLGRLPFEDSNESQVRNLIAHANPIRPRTLDASIPRDLEAIVLKCLARAPCDRYQGAHELLLDLQRFLSGEPVEAEKITWLRRARYILRRHPVAVAALGLTLIANVAAITGLVVALHIEQAAREIEHTSKDRERIAKDIERSAKEKESNARAHAQTSMAEIVSIYTGVADKIFAGSRISGEEMLTPLQKAVAILDEYTDENPDDEKMLHRLSVLKHYLAIAYQHAGNYDGFIDQRIDVLNILTQLIAKHPNNTTYQFQRFFSRQLLGVWLVDMPGHRPASLSTNADELLELALSDIEQLVTLQPDNIDYVDALAAAKIKMSSQVSMSDPPRSGFLLEQGIASSEKLWNDHPDRPQLAKHAIKGYKTKATRELKQSLISDAYESGRKAIDLFDRAWRSKSDELWVIDDAGPVFDMWADVLIAKQEWSEALRVLDERDRFTAALQSEFSHQVAYVETRFRDGLKRICILRKMGDDQRISETENRLLDLIEQHRGNNEAILLLRKHLAPYEASESIRMRLAN